MPKPVTPSTPAAAVIAEETALWQRVLSFLTQTAAQANEQSKDRGVPDQTDAELLELRDALAEAKPEDIAPLIEQMTRLSAVAAGRRGKVVAPVDIQAPYFAHLRLRPTHPPKASARDVLIGRRGFIDRGAGIQIVDWRDAPVSQIYYRYDEGDDYDELIGGTVFQGVLEARRNVTIQGGKLRRIGCPQGTFFCDETGGWWEADALVLPTLAGGQGLAARAPRPAAPAKPTQGKGHKPAAAAAVADARPSFATRADKHLPEIAALIDPDQFELITKPDSGVVVIQGGAGSGKTTVALHRVAYLAYQKPERFRGSKVMVVVPSEALVRYVSGVLPALGVNGVPVTTSAGWMRHHRKRLLPHLPDRRPDNGDEGGSELHSDTPAVVSRLKKHPGMLRLLESFVADQAAQARVTLGAALTERPDVQARVLAEWDARGRRPLRLRCRGVRHALEKEGLKEKEKAGGSGDSEAGLLQRLDELLRRLWRRAGDVTRDWAEALTDPERLWNELGPQSPSHLPHAPVTRAEIAELTTYCQRQQEEVETLPEDVDPERFQAVDGRPLDEDSPAGQLDVEDDPLLLYLYQLKYGGLESSASQSAKQSARKAAQKGESKPAKSKTSATDFVSYEHLVLDEVQDLSAVEVKVLISCVSVEDAPKEKVGRQPEPSITMAGDVAQRLIFDNGFVRWEDLLKTVGLRAQIQRLRIAYRSTAEVMELSHAVLGPLLTDDSVQAASRHGAPVRAFRFDDVGEAVAFLGEALRSLLLREPTASVALIARHSGTATAFFQGLQRADVPSLRRVARHEFTFAAGVDVTDVTQVKGLEFDYVVLLDATEAAYPDSTEARHLMHIAMTRSAHQLWLLATGAPSPLIPPSYFADETASVAETAPIVPGS